MVKIGKTWLAYGMLRQDPVFIIGQGAGLFDRFRSLQFLWRGMGASNPD